MDLERLPPPFNIHKRPVALVNIVLDPISRRLLDGQVGRLYFVFSINLAAPCAGGRSGDRVRLAAEMQARTDRKFHSWSDRGLGRLLESARATASVQRSCRAANRLNTAQRRMQHHPLLLGLIPTDTITPNRA